MDFIKFVESVDFVSNKWVLIVPCVMMMLDFITGFAKAWANNNIKSAKMRVGFVKKLGELIVIIAVELLVHGTNIPRSLLNFTSAWVVLMEFISIIENTSAMGFKIPSYVMDKLHISKGGENK